jgi:hypothetical protein
MLEKAAYNTRVSDQDSRFKTARTAADEQVVSLSLQHPVLFNILFFQTACIREARENWEAGVNEELLAVIAESRREYLLVRPQGSVNRKLEHIADDAPSSASSNPETSGNTTGVTQVTIQPTPMTNTHVAPLEEVRFLYDSDDLFEALVAIRNPNMKQAYEDRIIGQIKLNLQTPNNAELCLLFPELNPSILVNLIVMHALIIFLLAVTQVGIDDKSAALGNKLCFVRHDEADMMCANSCCPILDARRYLKRGCLPSYRAKLYRAALQLPEDVCVSEQVVFAQLRMECDRIDLLTDDLYLHDVQNIIDDTRFFVFEVGIRFAHCSGVTLPTYACRKNLNK